VHFSETYHAYNPVLRVLLEKRVHRFISRENDRVIEETLNKGIKWLRHQKGRSST
jgi:hypothetical protein